MGGKHSRPGRFRRWWRRAWCAIWGVEPGPGVNQITKDWQPYKLQSRKYQQLLFVDTLVLVFGVVMVWLLHISESAIAEKALDVLQNITIAYFGLNVLQKGIEKGADAYVAVKGGKPEPPGEAAESEEI